MSMRSRPDDLTSLLRSLPVSCPTSAAKINKTDSPTFMTSARVIYNFVNSLLCKQIDKQPISNTKRNRQNARSKVTFNQTLLNDKDTLLA